MRFSFFWRDKFFNLFRKKDNSNFIVIVYCRKRKYSRNFCLLLFLVDFAKPKSELPLTSIKRITVISRSSSKTFTNGLLYLTVTFQSIERTSSGDLIFSYFRKGHTLTFKSEWYSPEKNMIRESFSFYFNFSYFFQKFDCSHYGISTVFSNSVIISSVEIFSAAS